MTPSSQDFWFLPLGGTGEIGMNVNLYGHAEQWLMVDCGITFDEPLTPVSSIVSSTATTNSATTNEATTNAVGSNADKHPLVTANIDFISKQRQRLQGIVLTHAHEDHIGALAYLWPRLGCPVYATAFTAEVVRRKLSQLGLQEKVPLFIIDPTETLQLGTFNINWLATTHSIPEPYALVISTPLGRVLHTADWKIDAHPVTSSPFQPQHFKALQEDSITALVGDSTNATKAGFSVSERACYDGLLATIKPLTGRVVVACFASNIARLISLARIALKTDRYLSLFGRSLQNMYSIARAQGLWPTELSVIDPSHAGYLPPQEVLIVATGSQGERRAALGRLADDCHPHLALEKGDTVLFSSIVIPGNEKAVNGLIIKFEKLGVDVIQSEYSVLPIHASGHPCQEELKLMYHWVKPEIAIPVHGEPQHLQAHAEIAQQCGVKKTYVGRNGDLYLLAPQPGIRRGKVKAGRIAIEQK